MRNGTQSNKLTLVDSASSTINDIEPETKSGPVSPVLVLFTVSLACATAAIAAGSYALWLSRQKAARQTLIDVQDILKRCQDRMHQMEDDLNHLPSAVTTPQN